MLALDLIGQQIQSKACAQADEHEQQRPQDRQECENGIEQYGPPSVLDGGKCIT